MTRSSARAFVMLLGVVSLFGDTTYEGARSILGPYLLGLGASAAVVGGATGLGELAGYLVRLPSGRIADRTRRYWPLTIAGYAVGRRSGCVGGDDPRRGRARRPGDVARHGVRRLQRHLRHGALPRRDRARRGLRPRAGRHRRARRGARARRARRRGDAVRVRRADFGRGLSTPPDPVLRSRHAPNTTNDGRFRRSPAGGAPAEGNATTATLTDAGPLVALIDAGERRHYDCVAALRSIGRPLLSTWPVFTEAVHVLREERPPRVGREVG